MHTIVLVHDGSNEGLETKNVTGNGRGVGPDPEVTDAGVVEVVVVVVDDVVVVVLGEAVLAVKGTVIVC